MIINKRSETGLSSFHVVFEGSVMNEKPGWYGLSHLMEHLVCKGFEHLQDDFQRYDIKWNAYTSSTNIVFYIKGLDEYIQKYKDEFLKGILTYNVTDEELQHEKLIILEEYKDSFNSQLSNHYLNLYRKKYGIYLPIGERDNILNYTIDDAKSYQYLYLKNPTLIANVSKYNIYENEDIKFRKPVTGEPIRLLEDPVFRKITTEINESEIKDAIPLELTNEFKSKESIIYMSSLINKDHNKVNFICRMLSDGLNSPLYKEVREKSGLAYYVTCFVNQLNHNTSNVIIATETSPDNTEKVKEKINEILSNKEKFLTKDRFKLIKENLLVRTKTEDILLHDYTEQLYKNPEFNINTIVNSITLDEVYEIFNDVFSLENLYTSVYSEEFK